MDDAVFNFQFPDERSSVEETYGNIRNWCVSNITDFSRLFFDVDENDNPNLYRGFNEPLDGWDMSNAESTYGMFWTATAFNGDITTWDVSSVTNMGRMFDGTAFNQPIGNWSTSAVTNMYGIFGGARGFNQDISGWVNAVCFG